LSPKTIQMDERKRLLVRKACLSSLFEFCKSVMGYDDISEEVHGTYCRFLESSDPRKQITMPRSFVKTWIGSIAYPIWISLPRKEADEYPEGIDPSDKFYNLGPNIRILVASYVIANSMKMVGLIRRTYERNPAMRALFPDVIPENFNKTRWSNSEACINRSEDFTEATFEAGGIGGSTTSRHYDLIIEDDLIYANKDDLSGQELQPNQEDIDKAIGWHKLATSLLVPGAHTRIHNCGTRWAKHDLVDYIWTHEPHYKVFKIAITKDMTRDGEPTWPEMYGRGQIEMILHAQGFYMFATQYLLQPMAPEDMLFKKEWLEFYGLDEALPKNMRIFTTVDLAGWKESKRKGRESRGVIMTCGWTEKNHCYILRYDVGRFDPSQVINLLYSHHAQFNPERMAVEVVYYQEALMHFLKLEMEKRGFIPVRALETATDQSKELRIRSLEPYAMNHAIHCRVDHKDFIDEYCEYVPNSQSCRKDMLDALAYQLQIARPGEVGDEESRAKRNLNDYKFAVSGDEVLEKLMERGKPTGIFKEYKTSEDYDPYREDDFEDMILRKWIEGEE